MALQIIYSQTETFYICLRCKNSNLCNIQVHFVYTHWFVLPVHLTVPAFRDFYLQQSSVLGAVFPALHLLYVKCVTSNMVKEYCGSYCEMFRLSVQSLSIVTGVTWL